jgi:uncharacterized protein (DUF885 family)
MISRRHLLAGSALAPLAAASRAQAAASSNELTPLLDSVLQRALALLPQLLTSAGLDTGPNAGARSLLNDRSPDARARMRRLFEDMKTGLGRFDPARLQGMDWINHQSALYLADTTLAAYDFGFGDPDVGPSIPYVVSQLSGSYRAIPGFLASLHPVVDQADAEAYLARLSAFAVVLDQETEWARSDHARGAVPPDFVLRTALRQFEAMLAPAPSASELVTALVRRTRAAGIEGDWETRAARIVEAEVYPALRRQAGLLQGALEKAPTAAGVWRLPEGERFYRHAVRAATTTALSGDEIHRLGMELVKRFSSSADAILRSQGLTRGTVAERLAALRKDPKHLYANSDEGRRALLADLERRMEEMREHLPRFFGRLPQAPVRVQRMPTAIEAGAPGATYQPGSLDGKRPGLFEINLRNVAEWPRFDLPTLVYHEALPGHHLQNTLRNEAEGLPLLRRMPLFSGYQEGWALYAEQLADEMGVYRKDPLGRLGYMASMLFRAARLVVDSGLHHKRWTRDQAVAYMSATLGDAPSATVREVERYCVQPAQACCYMLGWRTWTEARARAQAVQGKRFDIRAFHDAGLLNADMPLDLLTQVLERWARTGKAA